MSIGQTDEVASVLVSAQALHEAAAQETPQPQGLHQVRAVCVHMLFVHVSLCTCE